MRLAPVSSMHYVPLHTAASSHSPLGRAATRRSHGTLQTARCPHTPPRPPTHPRRERSTSYAPRSENEGSVGVGHIFALLVLVAYRSHPLAIHTLSWRRHARINTPDDYAHAMPPCAWLREATHPHANTPRRVYFCAPGIVAMYEVSPRPATPSLPACETSRPIESYFLLARKSLQKSRHATSVLPPPKRSGSPQP